jgi:GTP-binding protein
MSLLPQVVLVGRPNVGKSRMFNRLVGRRVAIVHDMPGVTRDLNSAEVEGRFILLDTGGLGLKTNPDFQEIVDASELQVEFAVEMADLVLFMVDGKEGLTGLDQEIAERLRKNGKQVILVVNKSDALVHENNMIDFYSLGFKKTVAVSAEHGLGMDDLWDGINEFVEEKSHAVESENEADEEDEEDARVKICFIGKPNVGKSSLSNAVLRTDRMIVSSIPGTTRDTIRQDFEVEKTNGKTWKFTLLDTAGYRNPSRITTSVDYFSSVRSNEAMEEADVVFLVVDAKDGPGRIEKQIGGNAIAKGRALAVIVNKWDYVKKLYEKGERVEGYEDEPSFRAAFEESLREQLFFLPDSPVLFVSAMEHFQLTRILKTARELYRRQRSRIPTATLNNALERWTMQRSPRYIKGKAFKIYYAVQTGTRPFRFKLFCNRAGKLEDSYKKFLQNKLINEFDLAGCPIEFELVGKEVRYTEEGRYRRKDTVLPSRKPGSVIKRRSSR